MNSDIWVLQPDVQIRAAGNRAACTLLNRRQTLVYDVDGPLVSLLTLLTEPRSTASLVAWAGVEAVPEAMLHQTLTQLATDGVVLRGSHPVSPAVLHHRLFSVWAAWAPDLDAAVAAWDRWSHATVAVIGLGGVGGRVAIELAAMGIGHLLLIDPDVVESHNASHQPWFTRSDAGSPKVAVLSRYLGDRFDTTVDPLVASITETLDTRILHAIARADVVVACADEPSVDTVADWITPGLFARGIPHLVGGGYHSHFTSTGTAVVPGTTLCWRCLDAARSGNPETPPIGPVVHRGIGGSFNPLVQFLSSLLVGDVAAMVTRLWPPFLANRLGDYDWRTGSFRWRSLPETLQTCPHVASAPAGTFREEER